MPEARSHTFVFVDLVGYTALAASEGDERAADVALELACARGAAGRPLRR